MKVALITGGAGAIGAATARMMAQDGFAVVLVDLKEDETKAIAADVERLGGTALAITADLNDRAAPGAVVQSVKAAFGRLDCLVNNAGRTGASLIGSVEIDEWDAILRLNMTVPMLLCQHAAPLLAADGGGSIVNVASRVYLSGTGIGYTSSKTGLVGLTRALAVQLGKDNIRVNAVAPSFLNTPFNKKIVERSSKLPDSFRRMSPLNRIGAPEDVAGAIAFLASDRASFITGDVLHVCGGTQLAPQPD